MSDQHIFTRYTPLNFFFLPYFVGRKWLVVSMMVLLLVPSSVMGITTEAGMKVEVEGTIQRLNYGVLFESKGSMYTSVETWPHTFEIPLPNLPNISNTEGICGTLKGTYCASIKTITGYVQGIQLETKEQLSNLFDFVHVNVPKINVRTRTQRSLLPFIGGLSKSLFGTATTADVKLLASHITALNRRTGKMLHVLEQHGRHLSSYMTMANRRMDNLKTGIVQNFHAINNLTKVFSVQLSSLDSHLFELSKVLYSQISKSTKLLNEFAKVQLAVQSLVQGKLSPILIPEPILKLAIKDITDILNKHYNKFSLIYTNTEHYYKRANFHFGRHGLNLYVTLRFPITAEKAPLQLYKVRSLPSPVNASSTHGTQILDLPDYFAVTSHQQYFLTLSKSDLTICRKHNMYLCPYNRMFQPITQKTCILSLFANNKDDISSLCNFRYLEDIIMPSIHELSSTYVLIYSSFNLAIDCQNKQEVNPGCNMCVLHLPCGCSITSQYWYYPPRLAECQGQQDHISTFHPINLALIQEFFNKSALLAISSETLFTKHVEVVLPSFNFYNHTMHDKITADQKFHLSMKKITKASKNDEKIFKSLAEPILDGQIDFQTSWPDTDSILLICTMAVTFLVGLLGIYAVFKTRKLATALLLLQQSSAVKSDEVPKFIYKTVTTPTSTSTFTDITDFITWEHLIVALLVITLILTVTNLALLTKRNARKKGMQVLLEITSGSNCVTVTLLTLPLCPSFYIITPPIMNSGFILSKFPGRTLYFDWSEFSVTNKISKCTIPIRNKTKLTWSARYMLSKILKEPHMAYILLEHNGTVMPLLQPDQADRFPYFNDL